MSNKVFIGNLNFRTTSDDLGKKFAEVGEVTGSHVISRGNYSLGYGFVEFKTPEIASKAVESMNHSEIDGRQVNVEIAKPRVEGPAATGAVTGAPGARPARRFRRGGRFNPRFGGYGYGYRYGYGRRFNRRFGGARRGRRTPRNDENAPLSNTRLFVTNLPFDVRDEELSKMFEGLGVKNAHVAVRQNGMSRGFGFVEVDSHENQQSALTKLDKTDCKGRQIIVRVAREQPPKPEVPVVPVVATDAAAAAAAPAVAPIAPVVVAAVAAPVEAPKSA